MSIYKVMSLRIICLFINKNSFEKLYDFLHKIKTIKGLRYSQVVIAPVRKTQHSLDLRGSILVPAKNPKFNLS